MKLCIFNRFSANYFYLSKLTLYLPADESVIEDFEAIEGVTGVETAEHNGQATVKLELASGGYDFFIKEGKLTVEYADGYTAEGSGEPESPGPVVESVSITPRSAVVEKGQTYKFAAAVTGQNDPSQEVIWSVEGAASDKTVISADGVLTVGEDETAEQLTVKAVSKEDGTKSAAAAVTVKEAGSGGTGEPGGSQEPGNAQKPAGSDTEGSPEAPQTGDSTNLFPAAAAVLSLIVLAWCGGIIFCQKRRS